MYVGRFVIVGGDVAAYRVSSRSFPNRQIVRRDGVLTVAPTATAEETDNPYVSYNCYRQSGDRAVLGNGSHVDPIAEKLDLGYPPRDALATGLLTLDFERDEYDTPRLAGVLGEESYLGIVRRDALLVEAVADPTLVATYELDSPEMVTFEATTASDAAQEAYEKDYEHPVCAMGVARTGDGFDTAIRNQ